PAAPPQSLRIFALIASTSLVAKLQSIFQPLLGEENCVREARSGVFMLMSGDVCGGTEKRDADPGGERGSARLRRYRPRIPGNGVQYCIPFSSRPLAGGGIGPGSFPSSIQELEGDRVPRPSGPLVA